MFNGLRQGATLYILSKADRPTLELAQVVSVSNMRPKQNAQFGQYGLEQVVDVTVNQKTGQETYNDLPAQGNIANYRSEGVVVSDSKEAMLSEVMAMEKTSSDILSSIEYHQNVVESCHEMQLVLNPQLAKDKEYNDRLGALEDSMNSMSSVLKDIKSMLSAKS